MREHALEGFAYWLYTPIPMMSSPVRAGTLILCAEAGCEAQTNDVQ